MFVSRGSLNTGVIADLHAAGNPAVRGGVVRQDDAGAGTTIA